MRRAYRVAAKIREIIASAVLFHDEELLRSVTITSSQVSKDLRHAKVYWMVHGDEADKKALEEFFQRSAKEFRSKLAENLGTRFVPELRFFYDETLDEAQRIDDLMRRAKEMSPEEELP